MLCIRDVVTQHISQPCQLLYPSLAAIVYEAIYVLTDVEPIQTQHSREMFKLHGRPVIEIVPYRIDWRVTENSTSVLHPIVELSSSESSSILATYVVDRKSAANRPYVHRLDKNI